LTPLTQAFWDCPPAPTYWVAYSGGLDSETLLFVTARHFVSRDVRAIHIHHGLSPNADRWEAHCQASCARLKIPLITKKIRVQPKAGESLEGCARHARYAAFREILGPNDVLIMAHHQDDQAETFLLQALRGAGIQGLSAMPRWQAPIYRPWLHVPRADIQSYARAQGILHIDDESNFDTNFDRNFLRHEILPDLQQRWPQAGKTLARSAALTAESMQCLRDYVAEDYQSIVTERETLSVSRLQRFSEPKQRAIVRHWCQELNHPLPTSLRLARILKDVLSTRQDAMPLVRWGQTECRRYADEIYLLSTCIFPPMDWSATWNLKQPLLLPPGCGILRAIWSEEGGLRLPTGDTVTVQFRRGGETLQREGHTIHHTLKNCWQQWGIPPWQRRQIPLIYSGSELAMVVDVETMAGFFGQPGWRIHWERSS